jgi:hypothetical protein
MAITFVQGAATRGSVSTITCPFLSSATNGDILILAIAHAPAVTYSAGPTGGWTLIQELASSASGFVEVFMHVYYKHASAETTAVAQISFNDFWAVSLMAFRNQNGSSSAIDAHAMGKGSATSAVTCPTVTLTNSGGVLLAIGAMYGTNITGWNLGGFTQAAATSANAINICAGYNTGPWASGNTGTMTYTASGTNSQPWVGFTLGLIQSAAATTVWNFSSMLLGVGR